MTKVRGTSLAAGLILAGYFLVTGSVSRHFPPVNTDEVFIAVHGINLITGHGQRYSLYDDLFAPSVYAFRDAFPQTMQTLYNTWVGIWISLAGKGYWQARLSSLVAGTAALWMVFLIGRKMGGPKAGLLASLILACCPLFLMAGSIVRPETSLLLTTSLILWFILRTPDDLPWKEAWVGALAGLQIGVHPNALPLSFGIAAFYLTLKKPQRVGQSLAITAAGFLLGLLAMFLTVDLFRLWLCGKTMFAKLYRPPILAVPFSFTGLVKSALNTVGTSQTYYFSTTLVKGWKACILAWQLGLAICIFGCKSGDIPYLKPLMLGFLAAWGAEALFLSKHEALYLLNLFPFLIPLLGLFFVHGTQRELKFLAASCFVVSAIFYGSFVKRSIPLYVPYPTMVREFKQRVPAGSKVAGPNLFWFEWKADEYRDAGALVYSRWYTGGKDGLRDWLLTWKPDVLIVNDTLKQFVLGPGDNQVILSKRLKTAVKRLGVIEAGPGANGFYEIYQIHWT